MQWSDIYTKEQEPSLEQIADYIDTPLWSELVTRMQQTYKAAPKVEYSACAMDGGAWKGWNVKFKKSGKNLCTLYPKAGYFLALITIANKNADEAEILASNFSEYTQEMYEQTDPHAKFGRMLGLEVRTTEILEDLTELIALRAG